jgi:O-antigen ligase
MSAWHTPQFFKQGTWWAVFDTTWSHNGYHDLLLGGGVLSGLLFVAVVWFGVQAIGSEKSLREAIPSFLMIAFVLAAATQESFFIGTHFLWALLIVGLFVPRHMDGGSRGELVE